MASVELVQNGAQATLESGDRKQTSIDYRLGRVQVKTRSDGACSLFSLSSLFSGMGKKKLIPLSPFHCNIMENSMEVP